MKNIKTGDRIIIRDGYDGDGEQATVKQVFTGKDKIEKAIVAFDDWGQRCCHVSKLEKIKPE